MPNALGNHPCDVLRWFISTCPSRQARWSMAQFFSSFLDYGKTWVSVCRRRLGASIRLTWLPRCQPLEIRLMLVESLWNRWLWRCTRSLVHVCPSGGRSLPEDARHRHVAERSREFDGRSPRPDRAGRRDDGSHRFGVFPGSSACGSFQPVSMQKS